MAQADRFRFVRLRLIARAYPECQSALSAFFVSKPPPPGDPDPRSIFFDGATERAFPVLSYRAYHDRKVPIEKLMLDTELRRIPGVGNARLKRLKQQGVLKIRDLNAADGENAMLGAEKKRLKKFIDAALRNEEAALAAALSATPTNGDKQAPDVRPPPAAVYTAPPTEPVVPPPQLPPPDANDDWLSFLQELGASGHVA